MADWSDVSPFVIVPQIGICVTDGDGLRKPVIWRCSGFQLFPHVFILTYWLRCFVFMLCIRIVIEYSY